MAKIGSENKMSILDFGPVTKKKGRGIRSHGLYLSLRCKLQPMGAPRGHIMDIIMTDKICVGLLACMLHSHVY
jgi:hypothetical protein